MVHKTIKGIFSRLKRAVLRFANNTNWHGLGSAIESTGVAKLVWSVIFLASLGVCIWQLIGVFNKYLSYPTSTSYILNYEPLDFPAVTICNLNPYKASLVSTIPSLNALTKYFAIMNNKSSTATGRKKRSVVQWPRQLQFADFDKDQSIGDITFEEFFDTVLQYYQNTNGLKDNPNWQFSVGDPQSKNNEDMQIRQKRGGSPADCSAVSTNTGLPSVTYIGVASGAKWESGTNITLNCAANYVIDPSISGTIWCWDGRWYDATGTVTPACVAVCPAITTTTGMLVSYSDTVYYINTIATFTCTSGYSMSPTTLTWKCQNGPVWNPTTLPTCRPLCPTLAIGGTNTYTPTYSSAIYLVSVTASVVCQSFYSLVGGTNFFTCTLLSATSTAVWSPNSTNYYCAAPCTPLTLTTGMSSMGYSDTNAQHSHLSTATVTCASNYQVDANGATATCNNGVWSFTPQCVAVCSALTGITTPLSVVYSLSTPYYPGTAATYQCSTPYIVSPLNKASICNSVGVWNDTVIPTCVIGCPSISISSATVTYSDPTNVPIVGSTATLNCATDYSLVGDSSFTCTSYGVGASWYPNTTSTSCAAPCTNMSFDTQTATTATITYTSTTASNNHLDSSTVTVLCTNNYILSGTTPATCTNGSWSNTAPSCLAPCAPISILNAQSIVYSNPNCTHSSTATVTCASGYVMRGNSSLTCANGVWAVQTWPGCYARCTAISISNDNPPAYFLYGLLATPDYIVNTTAVVSCNAPYQLVDATATTTYANYNLTLTCTTSGTWDQPVPQCRLICTSFTVSNGNITYSRVINLGGTVAKLLCNNGYKLYGGSQMTCVATDPLITPFWTPSPTLSYCAAPCSDANFDAQTLSNAAILYSKNTTNDTFTYHPDSTTVSVTCLNNYVLSGVSPLLCTNGTWYPTTVPTCLAPCPVLSIANMGTVSYSNPLRSPNSTAIVNCATNYILYGNTTVTCVNGVWMADTFPICITSCPTISLTNGLIQYQWASLNLTTSNRINGTMALISCNSGYVLSNASSSYIDQSLFLTCQSNGTWDRQIPICSKSCSAITVAQPSTINFTYSDANMIAGSTANFQCLNDSNGYTYGLVGSTVLTCLSTGVWSTTAPTCVIQCNSISLITQAPNPEVNITYSKAGTTMDRTPTTTATYKCPTGYIVFGILSSTCQSDGSWLDPPGGTTPYCLFMPPAVQSILTTMTNLTGQALLDAQARALAFLMTTLPVSDLATISYTKSELIVGCLMNEKVCADSDWETMLDSTLGACYRYNNQKPSKFLIAKPGRNLGLQVMLNTQQNEYQVTTVHAGFLVIIHKPGDTVFGDAAGYKVPPGYDTNFQMTYDLNTKQPAPYGTCVNDKSQVNVFYYTTDYSVEGCLRSCLQFITITKCGCADFMKPYPSSTSACDSSNSCPSTVSSTVTMDDLTSACSCPPPCTAPNWGVTVSQSTWPHRVDPILTYKSECVNASSGYTFTRNYQIGVTDPKFESCYESFRRNYGRLNIYFNILNMEKLQTDKSYSIWNLMTDVGSNLGFFLGGSFITVGEFIHFILLAIMAICINPPPPKNPTADDDDAVETEFDDDQIHLTPAQEAELQQIVVAIKLRQMQMDAEESDSESDEDEDPNGHSTQKLA